MYLVAFAAARVERAGDARRAAFFGVLLVAYAGNVALLVAADVVTFYAGFAIMSLTAWALVAHDRTARARRAGRVYLALAVVGEALLLAGLLAAVHLAGPTGDAVPALPMAALPPALSGEAALPAVALLVAGLGVKVGLVPLHAWLPLAHPAAPVPASAVLSGAMVKAGLVGWLRMLPLGGSGHEAVGTVLVALGLVAVLGAAFVGLTQNEAKVQLAYSTVSQMGFLTVAVGAGLREPAAAEAAIAVAVVYALAHGPIKAALFLSVAARRAAVSRWRRIAVLAGVAVGALLLAGVPPGGAFVAKYGLKEVAAAAGIPDVVLSVGAVGTTLLLARVLLTLAAGEADVRRPPGAVEAGGVVLLVAGPLLTWWAAGTLPEAPVPVPAAGTVGDLWASVWPVLVGAGLVTAAVAARRAGHWPAVRAVRVPEGDVVEVLEPAAVRVLAGLGVVGRLPGSLAARAVARPSSGTDSLLRLVARLDARTWAALGPASVALIAAAAVLLAW
jgi:formate hydrogenlyase subunit 3/multisubunit Na+/H+ antiporter MnhD subunit